MRDKRIVATPIASIITRCLDPDPAGRLRTLHELRDALVAAAGDPAREPRFTSGSAWRETEAGIGLLALKQPDLALARFDAAYRIDPGAVGAPRARARAYAMGAKPDDPYTRLLPVAARGRLLRAIAAREQLAVHPATAPISGPSRSRRTQQEPEEPRRVVAWSQARDVGALREAERDFDGALAMFYMVRRDDGNNVALDLAMARCYINLGRPGLAVEHAGAVLEADPDNDEALGIQTTALFLGKQYPAALASADRWIASAPVHGRPHYVRGRCLFVLGRLIEARESFERACSLQPQLLEAQLLLRQVNGCIKEVRGAAGRQAPIELYLPEHLAELRAVLVDGRVDEAIERLSRAEYVSDPVAGLLVAGCVAFKGRTDEAIAIYERVATTSVEYRHIALVGKAHVLLALGRSIDAVVIFDAACAERPEDADATEGRAKALHDLGRQQEAEAESSRYVSLIGGRSELRVRSAGFRLPK